MLDAHQNISLPSGASTAIGDRQMQMKTIFIEHDRYKEAAHAIRRAHYPVEGGLPDYGRISALIGESRAGKSSVATRYMAGFPAAVGEGGMTCPVVCVAVPGDGQKALLTALADAVGLVYSSRIPGPGLLAMIMKQLVRQKVELLIFDEVNAIISENNPKANRHTLTLFRKLVDQCHLNIICIGLPETRKGLAGDPQITGRGGLPCQIVRPYSWESEEERGLFRLLCDEFDRRLPFNQRSNLGNRWFAERLFMSSGSGVIGRLSDFLYSAGCIALNDGTEAIEVRHFAEAYERSQEEGVDFNPWCHDLSLAPKKPPLSLLEGRHPRDVFSKKGGPRAH